MAATAGLAAWFCVGVALTKSFGAIVAGAAGIGTWALLVTFRAWISAHRRRALMLGWSLAALGVFGVIGYGVAFDRLPGWSLTFRWQYWTASAGMIADHGLTGVGRENFGRHYLRYKSIESPEEVSNPHNLFVQAAAEWGLLGLVGLVVMLVGGSAKILTAVTNAESEIRSRDGPDKAEAIPPFRWGSWWAAILASLLAVRFVLMETDDYNFVYYVSVASGIVWSIGFFGVVMGESGAGEFGNMFRTLKPAVAAGLGAFLLHDMINFASFVPGSATTAFALAALVIAGPIDKASGYTGATRSFGIFAACCAAGLVIVSIAGLAPVFRAWKYVVLADLKQTIYVDDGNGGAWLFYKQAAAADPLDPTPCVKEAEWLMRTISIGQAGPSAWTGAEAAIHEAIARDPFSHSLRRMKMRFYVERAQDLGDLADRMQAIEAAREALAVYPENPEGLIAFADRQREAAEAMLAGGVSVGDAGVEAFRLIDEAIGNFRSALALDGRRLSWEELHRIRMSERVRIQQIEAELVRLRESLEDR
jgi:tetratricopeptide (TPR) repeat protein